MSYRLRGAQSVRPSRVGPAVAPGCSITLETWPRAESGDGLAANLAGLARGKPTLRRTGSL